MERRSFLALLRTTACAELARRIVLQTAFLGWRLGAAHSSARLIDAFTAAFRLLCVEHSCLFAAALHLFIGKVTQQTPVQEAPVILEMMSK
jgi:hypothetical protein